MDSDIVVEHRPFLRIYKSGKIQRLSGTDTVPASSEPQNGVLSKDVVYSPENNLSVRLFLPIDITGKPRKLPLLIYFHGGAFVIESPFSPTYNSFLTAVVAEAECIAVSVEYSLAPENPIPTAYEDSWVAMKWVFDHFTGSGSEDWLNNYADFSRVFIAGDSAGANISHHMAMKSGEEKLISENVNDSVIKGIILIHPCFWGKDPIDEHDVKDESIRKGVEAIWAIANPNSIDGVNDRWINVVGSGSDFSRLSAERVLVFVAGNDMFTRRGWVYAAELEKSRWEGEVEVVEHKDEEHVFHLRNPNCGNAQELVKKFAGFINGKK